MTNQIVLLLGANLGDKLATLNNAVREIHDSVGEIVKSSKIYETAAWGKEDQPSYYNQVVVCKSNLSSKDLILLTQEIENKLGRVRKEKWGARIIDIDILFYSNEIISTDNLNVPHPWLHKRRFTLEPLTEILPNFIHPILNQSCSDLLLQCDDPLPVKKLMVEASIK
ncbi:2-amino-4-hydroxy-6-hydroxymethyldihydropteridine diphosphokinase [Flammeovirga pectinis]|uniref:2-amino-4-hydroxy-6-hydroxymethyldihydropteridine pyrophosphokinase n=1 Tax=Flammeovirga pectinis TaxID=2494373 RepID=A0A3Q9FMI2_9BACT|nr:2-amino-4-hydroxy-6-hydroxymethyldihydropteridine diphosphokinase [Flammeovirga pectinis]AZQ62077.1 2-amino-4-hydroxy-6-hydroxymethyldihydropteridine diphosphokinase [Flammeovirga pectinis]